MAAGASAVEETHGKLSEAVGEAGVLGDSMTGPAGCKDEEWLGGCEKAAWLRGRGGDCGGHGRHDGDDD